MTPSLDREIGMGAHATSFAGCGGSIKRDASDFAVSEVLGEEAMEMSRGGDGYAVFVMKKSGIDTPHALQAVRRATGMRLKALGLKDARAVTEQYVCATSRSTRLEAYSGRGVSLVPVGRAPRPLRGGDMVGNSFAIVVRGHDGTLGDFAEWDGVPNYYAYQRFGGARPVTHAIGRAIVAGDWARAVAEVLGRAGEGMTHAEMARGLPRGMDIERGVASAMASGAGELAALRTVPVGTRRLYVQAATATSAMGPAAGSAATRPAAARPWRSPSWATRTMRGRGLPASSPRSCARRAPRLATLPCAACRRPPPRAALGPRWRCRGRPPWGATASGSRCGAGRTRRPSCARS
ncbi:MAG: tRNA pseudouridine(13) synthase TruD [Thaumarchaeota archaeon S14]|nr:MAG: tRNA pseudouridine(13) synthase TruD [Thaumarchaeota archaeon S14]